MRVPRDQLEALAERGYVAAFIRDVQPGDHIVIEDHDPVTFVSSWLEVEVTQMQTARSLMGNDDRNNVHVLGVDERGLPWSSVYGDVFSCLVLRELAVERREDQR